MGDGRAPAWRFSARVRRWREAAEPIGGDASFEERGADSERKLARLAVARSAPPWAVTLCNRHKKGADLRCVMAGADPEGYRYAAARRTGIPILRALSIMLFVMPEPGKATRPFGRKFSRTSLRRKGAALPSRSQFGLRIISTISIHIDPDTEITCCYCSILYSLQRLVAQAPSTIRNHFARGFVLIQAHPSAHLS